MRLIDVVRTLIGPIEPVGETYEDRARYANLQTMTMLMEHMLGDIHCVAQQKDSSMASVKRAGKLASKFLHDLEVCE